MRKFCPEIENDPQYREHLQKKYSDIVEYYKDIYNEKNDILRIMLNKNFQGESLEDDLRIREAHELYGNVYSNIEAVIKLILSLYSEEPNQKIKWLDPISDPGADKSLHINFNPLLDLLQKHLKEHNEGQNLALAVLLEGRGERNGLTHNAKVKEVAAMIRIMNVFRDMLIFLEPENEGKLHRFEYPSENSNLDIQSFIDIIDPKERILVLVAGTLHDIPANQRELIANIPWTIVVDLDAASEFGGLYSSVNDKSLVNKVLWNTIINNPQPINNNASIINTKWYGCGDYLCYNSFNDDIPPIVSNHFSSYTALIDKAEKQNINTDKQKYINRRIRTMFENTIESLKNSSKPVTIIYMYDHEYASRFITKLDSTLENIGYTFLGIYYTNRKDAVSIAENIDMDFPEDDLDVFNYFCCDLFSFFSTLNEYRNQLPIIKPNNIEKTLPGKDGPKKIVPNRMQTLSNHFDILYNGCDICEENQKLINKNDFHRGKTIQWSVFKMHDGIVRIFEREAKYYLEQITQKLAHANKNNIVYIDHEPGTGGTTFCRWLCHELHQEWPVLCVNDSYSPKMRDMLESLYDDLKKGIVILADNMDTNDVGKLGSDLWSSQSRPFCIIANPRKDTTSKHSHTLNVLKDDDIEKLRDMYYGISPLPNKQQKYNSFAELFTDKNLRNPFMIALYFLDENFDGVERYVKQTLRYCENTLQIKIFAYTALFNIYNSNYPGVPENFAKYVTGLDQKDNFLTKNKFAESLIVSNKSCLRSRHYLMSKEVLKQTAELLYGMTDGNYNAYLHRFAIDFIDDYFSFLKNQMHGRFSDDDNEILRGMFVNKEVKDDSFSKIIEEIGINENSQCLFEHITQVSDDFLNDHCRMEYKPKLYNVIAHFYGHKGRFYRHDNRNLTRSLEAAKRSKENMEMGDGKDPYIYHMCGEAYRKMIDQIGQIGKYYNLEKDFDEAVNKCSEWFDEAVDMYEHVCESAGQRHSKYLSLGYLSLLQLYIRYIEVMCLDDGKSLLDENTLRMYHNDIADYIEYLDDTLDLDADMKNELNRIKDRYYSSYSKEGDINYYEGIVSSAKNSGNQERLSTARFGLLRARIRHWNENVNDEKDQKLIMELLDEICSVPTVNMDKHAKRRMMFAYRKWLLFARLNSKSVQEGIVKAENWRKLCEDLQQYDPAPYYNLYVLNYLQMLDGFSAHLVQDAEDNRKICEKYTENGEGLFGKVDTIRDLLVDGTGMGRLYPRIKHCKEPLSSSLMMIHGRFMEIQSQKGYIDIISPLAWKSIKAKFSMNKKITLAEEYYSHKVAFYGAFTYEQMTASRNIVADIDSEESLEEMYNSLSGESLSSEPEERRSKAEKNEKTPAETVSDLVEVIFYPERIFDYDLSGEMYLNGSVDVNGEFFIAGFNLNEFLRLDDVSEGEQRYYADKLIKAGDNGIPVLAKLNRNNRYTVMLSESYKSYKDISDLLEVNEHEEENKTEEPVQFSEKIPDETENVPKQDHSYMKGKTVKFHCSERTDKGFIGKFEYDGEKFTGVLQCKCSKKEAAKMLNKGHVNAVIISADKTFVLKK